MKRYKEPRAIKQERKRLERLGTVPCQSTGTTLCPDPISLRWFAEAHKQGHPVKHSCGRVLCSGRYCR